MTFPDTIEVMREVYRYRGEYVLLRDDVIVAHDPDLKRAIESVPECERYGLKVRCVPSDPEMVVATLSAY